MALLIYRDHDDVARQRAEMEAGIRALVDAGVQIDPAVSDVPTNFPAAYQVYDDRALQANLGRIYTGADRGPMSSLKSVRSSPSVRGWPA